jgi:putative ABC transport system substrate-binding protein
MRRALLAVILALLCGPVAATAQPASRLVRVGFLSAASAAADHNRSAFGERLRELGYVEGQNVVIESRWAEGRFERPRRWPPSWSV